MTRSQLFQIRFAATAALLLLTFLVVRFLWFPSGYYALSGISTLMWTLVGVNVVVGPALSTVVYKPGKWGLKFDLIAIAVVEVAILSWALAEIHERRPAFAVFAVDRFEAVTRSEVDLTQLEDKELANPSGFKPRLIYAELPTDIEVANRLIDETVFLGMKDIDRRPEFWKPYAQGMQFLKQAAMPLSALTSSADSRAAEVQIWLARNNFRAQDYLYLPIQGWSADGVIVLHADIGYPVDILAIDPWGDSAATE
jgi:hypothetical protein